MGIIGELKQISASTLEVLRQEPRLVELFKAARYLPESAFWRQRTFWNDDSAELVKKGSQEKFRRFRSVDKEKLQTLKKQFLLEWEIPELDLHKYWPELTFLLAGYIPGDFSSEWTIPELKVQKNVDDRSWWRKLFWPQKSDRQKDFFSFLVIDNSALDGLPLVNAIGAGAEIGYSTGYGPVRYLLPNEVEEILDGLIKLSEKGFQQRYQRESEQEKPCPWIDWSEEEMLEWMSEYYNEIVDYYRDASANQKAMLLYLT